MKIHTTLLVWCAALVPAHADLGPASPVSIPASPAQRVFIDTNNNDSFDFGTDQVVSPGFQTVLTLTQYDLPANAAVSFHTCFDTFGGEATAEGWTTQVNGNSTTLAGIDRHTWTYSAGGQSAQVSVGASGAPGSAPELIINDPNNSFQTVYTWAAYASGQDLNVSFTPDALGNLSIVVEAFEPSSIAPDFTGTYTSSGWDPTAAGQLGVATATGGYTNDVTGADNGVVDITCYTAIGDPTQGGIGDVATCDVIPEPSAAVLALLSTSALFLRRKK